MADVMVVKRWKDNEELQERGWSSMEDMADDLGYSVEELTACWFIDLYEGNKFFKSLPNRKLPLGEDVELVVSQVIRGRLFDDNVKFRILEKVSEDELIVAPLDEFVVG